jgi:predicted amidohydrolase
MRSGCSSSSFSRGVDSRPDERSAVRQGAEHSVYVSFGIAEDAGGALYNSQVLLDPLGAIVSVHRKIRMTNWDILNGSKAGSGITFSEIDGIPAATVICYESMSAEIARQIVEHRTRLVIVSLANMEDESYIHYDFAAYFYNAWVVAANRFGDEDGNSYDGHHWIADPSGFYRVKSTGSIGYVYAEAGFWP